MQQHFYTVLILAVAIAAAGCGTTAEKEMPPPLVRTVTVGDASSTGDTGYAGTVRGRYETKLAFQVGGQILSRNVNVGTRVRAGDVLMVIDSRDVQQKANAADAGVASARAQMQLARTNLARYEELYAAEASNALGYTHLVAGADGVISNITVEEGQVVAAGQTVMTLTQEGAREIEIAVPESRLSDVSVGMPAAVTLWADDIAYTGTVREIAPVADAATGTYAARIALRDAPAELPLGMTAHVRLSSAEAAGAVLPLSALYQTGDTTGVYIIEDGAVHLQPVTVTAFRDNDAVVRGLPAGAVIVTAGVHQLHGGEKVRTQ